MSVFEIVIGLFGGLALFLFGMDQMSDGLQKVAGESLKRLLERFTSNRFVGALTGAFATAVIQSSSVTTVLLVGFISAGLMTSAQSISVIMGANVGTTVTAQVIAFSVTQYALIPVAVGFALLSLGRKERVRQYGTALMGLGLIFFGMDLMGTATAPLRSYEPFVELMSQMSNPALGILAAALFTGVVQSSSATTGVIIVLAGQGFITLEAGIALVFGANIGTCVTALLAAIGKPREAVRAALVHVLFNVAGVLIWIGFIDELAALTRSISPVAESLISEGKLAAETPRQIANAHTIFNVSNTLVFIWFVTPLAWVMNKFLPRKADELDQAAKPRYLDELLIGTPALALDRVRKELGRLGDLALRMVDAIPASLTSSESETLRDIRKMDEAVDSLHEEIVNYLGKLSTEDLTAREGNEVSLHLAVGNYLESIGDMVETNLIEAGLERLDARVEISPETRSVLSDLHEKVRWAVAEAVQAFVDEDVGRAEAVIELKSAINDLSDAADNHIADRLVAEAPHRLSAYRIETQIVENLKRVYYFAKRVAKAVRHQI